MAEVRPHDLILRCYAYRMKNGPYYGVCVDLNLAVQADTPGQLRKKMYEVIKSYIETVFDTDDSASIPQLLRRPAPLRDWLMYYYIKLRLLIRQFPDNFTFNEAIPVHLAHT